jgi:hypothetical protein
MGRHKEIKGRWASNGIRLDIIRELRINAARQGVSLQEMVNRALWLGLQALRLGAAGEPPAEQQEPINADAK